MPPSEKPRRLVSRLFILGIFCGLLFPVLSYFSVNGGGPVIPPSHDGKWQLHADKIYRSFIFWNYDYNVRFTLDNRITGKNTVLLLLPCGAGQYPMFLNTLSDEHHLSWSDDSRTISVTFEEEVGGRSRKYRFTYDAMTREVTLTELTDA